MELFHLLNRGVDKRQIFLDDQDRARFVHGLYQFNNKRPAMNTRRVVNGANPSMFDLVGRTSKREQLIDLHGWCLMGNHYHLLVSERVSGGLTRFIMRLNVGYAKYFNEKYKRAGTLFQGRTRKILIDSDAHFLHILHYIHLNPLDFLDGSEDWRDFRIKDSRKALGHLNAYRWSSYLDYCGEKNFPSILTTGLFSDVYKNYSNAIRSHLKDTEQAPIEYPLE